MSESIFGFAAALILIGLSFIIKEYLKRTGLDKNNHNIVIFWFKLYRYTFLIVGILLLATSVVSLFLNISLF